MFDLKVLKFVKLNCVITRLLSPPHLQLVIRMVHTFLQLISVQTSYINIEIVVAGFGVCVLLYLARERLASAFI